MKSWVYWIGGILCYEFFPWVIASKAWKHIFCWYLDSFKEVLLVAIVSSSPEASKSKLVSQIMWQKPITVTRSKKFTYFHEVADNFILFLDEIFIEREIQNDTTKAHVHRCWITQSLTWKNCSPKSAVIIEICVFDLLSYVTHFHSK